MNTIKIKCSVCATLLDVSFGIDPPDVIYVEHCEKCAVDSEEMALLLQDIYDEGHGGEFRPSIQKVLVHYNLKGRK